jgi:hypothetical protein
MFKVACLQNKPLVHRVVLVAIDGLGHALQSEFGQHMPFTMSTLGKPAACCMEHDKAPYSTSLERLMIVPARKGDQNRGRAQEACSRPPQPPSYYELSLDDMRVLGFPVPVRPCFLSGHLVWMGCCTFDL